MGTAAPSPKKKRVTRVKKRRLPQTGKTEVVVVGLVLAIIGSIIAGSYEKNTLTNFAGFGMLLVGIATFILGVCSTTIANLNNRLTNQTPSIGKVNKPKMLCPSIWAISLGIILAVIGSILGNAFAKETMINTSGFAVMLTGICIAVLGAFGAALGLLRIELNKKNNQLGIKVDKPRILFLSILSMGIGIVLFVIGSILANTYEKQTIMNYSGFGMLLSGIVVLSVGISGTVASTLRSRLELDDKCEEDYRPSIILGSIWAIGIGAMLIINGSLIAGSFEKSTIINYAGFAMLLAGTGVFVYGLFETVRVSATGYLNNILIHKSTRNMKKCTPKKKETVRERLRNFRNDLLKTHSIINLAGVMVALSVLFFSLWQLDIIVSGPVWWSSLPNGQGTGWSHPNGAYSEQYFQCFLWKTTIGQAYDTLFMLIFISFIVLFASAFFWPRTQTQPIRQAKS